LTLTSNTMTKSAAIRFNPQCRMVYFDQRMAQLPLKVSLIDYVRQAEEISLKDGMALLAKAGFPAVRVTGPIGNLSHGERARLVFLQLKLARPNLYLLDEPTNHLDIEGQEDLEAELERAEVACLFVSHDRYFTRTAANRFLEIRKGKLVEVEDPEDFFDAQTSGVLVPRPHLIGHHRRHPVRVQGLERVGRRHMTHEGRPDVVAQQALQAGRHGADPVLGHAQEEVLLGPAPGLAILVGEGQARGVAAVGCRPGAADGPERRWRRQPA